MGEGPNSCPERLLLDVLRGEGRGISVFWQVSSLSWQKPDGLSALGNSRRWSRGGDLSPL